MSEAETSPEAEAPKSIKLDELEIKTFEVHFLKIQNLKMQADRLVEDTKRCRQMMLDEQTKLKAAHEAIGTKYGVDLSKYHIDGQGYLRPGSRTPLNVPGM